MVDHSLLGEVESSDEVFSEVLSISVKGHHFLFNEVQQSLAVVEGKLAQELLSHLHKPLGVRSFLIGCCDVIAVLIPANKLSLASFNARLILCIVDQLKHFGVLAAVRHLQTLSIR